MFTAEMDFPFTFACRRSGNCCSRPGGVVRVGAADVARIAAHLQLNEAAFRSRYLAASGDRLRENLGPACVFLRDGTEPACTIYDVRPQHCRDWPFVAELRDADALRAAMRFCPGIQSRAVENEART